jgi:4-hydroxy-tetrahydrodipicolinate synthase
MEEKMEKKYKGVYVVVCTPFGPAGELDEAALRRHIRYIMDEGGAHGIIPCGSTGEFAFLNEAEKTRVIEVTVDEVDHQLPVYAGVAACATRDVVANGRCAKAIGVEGIMVVPSYYGGLSQDELYRHYETIARGVDLPMILYNNTGTTHSDILPETVERLAAIDNIVAIKESTGSMQRVLDIQYRCGDNLEVLCGCDTLAFEMMAVGVEGWVAAPANVAARQCVRLYELMFVEQDIAAAKAYYRRIRPLFELFEGSGKYVQLAKAGLEMLGHGIGIPRPPLQPPSSDLLAQLKEILTAIND